MEQIKERCESKIFIIIIIIIITIIVIISVGYADSMHPSTRKAQQLRRSGVGKLEKARLKTLKMTLVIGKCHMWLLTNIAKRYSTGVIKCCQPLSNHR